MGGGQRRVPRYRNQTAAAAWQDGAHAPAPRGEERTLQRRCEAQLDELRQWGIPLVYAHIPDVRIGRGVAGRAQAQRKGLFDLIIGFPALGLVLAVELKTETGTLSPEQAAWLAAWGMRGRVCRSEGELLDFIREHGVVA